MDMLILQFWSWNFDFDTKNCAILWWNGTGKSSLSRKIFSSNKDVSFQMIAAQRNLTFKLWFSKWVQDDQLFLWTFGFSSPQWGKQNIKYLQNFSAPNSYNNIIQDDFNENLEKLFRDDRNTHASQSKKSQKTGKVEFIETNADKIFNIWQAIFWKSIEINENWRIIVTPWDYPIENLSDGERSALYLIMKCIHAPSNSIIIVDEWETHLNSALLHELRDNIEQSRSDCRFIYISHDIEFITSRVDCTKYRIKNYTHPNTRELEKVKNEELPEELLLQILWAKKQKILFIEGEENYEKLLYQKLYPDFKVIPLWSCDKVISFTKALNNSLQNYHKSYFWIIDRDFRSDEEVKSLEESKIYTLPVAEFENIILKKNVIQFIYNHLGRTDFSEKFKLLSKSVFELVSEDPFKKDFFKYHIQQKINLSFQTFALWTRYEFNDDYIEINKIRSIIEAETNYDNILLLLNHKGIKGTVNKLWYNWNDYINQVLNIFNTNKGEDFRNKFLQFMPNIS